jgi:hypothetical protein
MLPLPYALRSEKDKKMLLKEYTTTIITHIQENIVPLMIFSKLPEFPAAHGTRETPPEGTH